jgi:DNA-binding MarR family transcriptional regulator
MQPQDTVSYWLSYVLRYVGSAFAEVLRAHCGRLGKGYVITPPQWALMALLSANNGQTIGTLAQQLGVDAPAITAFIGRLEPNGLVERVHDLEDRRIVRVYLTAEGQDIIHSLDSVVAQFNEQMLPLDQQQVFFEQLRELITRVSTVAPGVGDRFGFLQECLRQRDHERKAE